MQSRLEAGKPIGRIRGAMRNAARGIMRNAARAAAAAFAITLTVAFAPHLTLPFAGSAPGAAFASSAPGTASLGFSDVKGNEWFQPYLAELVAKQLARGNADGTYAPDKLLFVDEFLALALRTLGRDQGNAPGYWAKNYIDEAMRSGLVEPGEYAAYDVPITREQIARVAVRALGGEEFGDYAASAGVFRDLGDAMDAESVLKAIDRGILAGYPDGTFRPQANATRAEAATMVVRMIDKTYRLERYGDVFFNARTDLNETGNVKKEKVYDFVMSALETLRIEPDADGKVVVSGVVPEVPDGQIFLLRIELFNKEGLYIGYASTLSEIQGEIINKHSPMQIKTTAHSEDVAMIHIILGVVTQISPRVYDGTATYIVNKDYFRPKYNYFFRNDENLPFDYDFSLTEGVWGW